MKKSIFMLGIGISSLAMGQHTDPYADFNAQKQSIELSTGITMKYIQTGNPAGMPVILLHGATDTGRSFQLMMEELIQINQNLRIIAPDLRGHGETSMPSDCAAAPEQCFTMAAFASDIIALMDQKNIPQAHVVAHSMGSMVAQDLALHHAERVSSLVLIGTFVDGINSSAIHEFLIAGLLEGSWKPLLEAQAGFRWPEDAYTLTPNDLGSEVTDFLKKNWVYEIATDEAYLQAVYRETVQTPIGTWIGAIRALGEIDNGKALENLQVPTLVLWPTQDMFFSQPDQEKVKSALATAARRHGTSIIYKTYGKIPLPPTGYQENDLGHNLHWAAPKAVAADVSSFIKIGFPVDNISFVNSENLQQVLTEEGKDNIVVLGSEKVNP
jgi:pimeloyl-ACP methyl ester carboxylesterase